jgi:hypothetical protein
MCTIHVLRSARNYFIDGISWGDDEEGVILYLRAQHVSPDEITKTLEGVAQTGGYVITQRTSRTHSHNQLNLLIISFIEHTGLKNN